MSPNSCLNSFYIWEIRWWIGSVDFRGRAVFSSVRASQTVREGLEDGPRAQCSLRVLRVLVRLRFRSVVPLSFRWTRFRMVRVCWADSPRVPGGQSTCSPRTVRFSGFATEGSVGFNGRSAALGRTVRGTCADSPRYPAGQSARPVRTVCPTWPDSPRSLAALLFGSSLPFLLSCFRVCFKESFLWLEVDP
jgi:hypothetical protein